MSTDWQQEQQATPEDVAQVDQIKRWAPIWIVPVVTVLIGIWILFYHFIHQGPQFTLLTSSAEGIVAGKTVIKSRSVDVGLVESVVLSNDLHHVIITARLNSGMQKLLSNDTAFWVVKPQVGREGVSGLSTLFSGAYIELLPGNHHEFSREFNLLDAPPLAPLDAKGIRILLTSEDAGPINIGDPILFHGYRVGSVESSRFDIQSKSMLYQVFIASPYDHLVTSNVRFWRESGISVDMSAQGIQLNMAPLSTLLNGGISFDLPDGWQPGSLANNKDSYHLFGSHKAILDSLYDSNKKYLMLFDSSVRGLQVGAPIEFRGIRLGTVAAVPYWLKADKNDLHKDFSIPILVKIEPQRFQQQLGKTFIFDKYINQAEKMGLRATLKTANLLTGSLYIDLDFYPNVKSWQGPRELDGYKTIPTTGSDLNQIQQRVSSLLDKLNKLPLNNTVNQADKTLAEGQKTLKKLQQLTDNLNRLTANQATQQLPADLRKTLQNVNQGLQQLQPGSPAYQALLTNMQQLNQVMRELQPLLNTLNHKSNALIFAAPKPVDPLPKKASRGHP